VNWIKAGLKVLGIFLVFGWLTSLVAVIIIGLAMWLGPWSPIVLMCVIFFMLFTYEEKQKLDSKE